MGVKRIVKNIRAEGLEANGLGTNWLEAANAFYADLLGMRVVMDLGWIVTLEGSSTAPVQITVAREGGSGTPVPDISVEVDDFDAVLTRLEAGGVNPEYGPVLEPWGVRRVFVRDPFGTLVNILEHR
jgi:catechol 2,3-dioxygenase-like lactoylglutathione lyase family enzyme